MELKEKYLEKSKTELRKMAPDVYAYLYRNDRDWLNTNSPVKKRIHTSNQRVDLEKRDKEMLKQVKKILRNWDMDAEKPTKITVTSIGKKLINYRYCRKKQISYPIPWNISVKYPKIQYPSKKGGLNLRSKS